MPFESRVQEITRMERMLYRWPCSIGLRYHINRLKRQEAGAMRGYIKRAIKDADPQTMRDIIDYLDNRSNDE